MVISDKTKNLFKGCLVTWYSLNPATTALVIPDQTFKLIKILAAKEQMIKPIRLEIY